MMTIIAFFLNKGEQEHAVDPFGSKSGPFARFFRGGGRCVAPSHPPGYGPVKRSVRRLCVGVNGVITIMLNQIVKHSIYKGIYILI